MKSRLQCFIVCLFAFLIFCFNKNATATSLVQVSRDSFGQGTVYESFEEPADLANGNYHSNSTVNNVFLPGAYGSYTFSQSGIKLTAPIPNIEKDYYPEIAICSTARSFGLNVYGGLNLSNQPPDGTHYLVEYGSSSILFSPFALELPYGVKKFGGYWFMSGQTPGSDRLQIDAYGLSNQYLGSVLVLAASTIDKDWSNNFYGFTTNDESYIKTVKVNYWSYTTNVCNPGCDMLMFSVPEPPEEALLVAFVAISALYFLLRFLKKKKRQ